MQPFLQEVLPWALGFVILDALVQLRVGQVLVVWTWPGAARALGPGVHAAGAWPTSEGYPCHELPFLAAGDGAWFRDPAARASRPVLAPDELRFVAWADLARARHEGRRVVAAGRTVVKALSAAGAAHVASRLRELADAGEGRSDVLAAQVRDALDPAPLRGFRAATRRARGALAAIGAAWSVLLLAILPLLAWTELAVRVPAVPVLLGAVALALAAALLAARTLRAAGASSGAALARAAPIALFPPLAARALPHACREAQLWIDPLAALAALAPADAVAAACRRELVRVAHARAVTAHLGLGEFWAVRARAVRALVARESLVAQVDARPAAAPGAACVCPLCDASYRVRVDACADCGIPVVAASAA